MMRAVRGSGGDGGLVSTMMIAHQRSRLGFGELKNLSLLTKEVGGEGRLGGGTGAIG
jgi:hypothetical protein